MNTNAVNTPNWRTLQSKVKLPEDFTILDELAHNLWWVWNSDAVDLFSELDPDLWEKYNNPVISLHKISPGRLLEIKENKVLVDKVKNLSPDSKSICRQEKIRISHL